MGLINEFFADQPVSVYQWRSFDDLRAIMDSSDNCHRVFAYSFMTYALEMVKEELEVLCTQCADTDWIIAGGPHPTADPEGCLHFGFHRVFVGESERTLVRFIQDILDGALPQDKTLVRDCEENPVNLDDYPPFDYNTAFWVPIELSRGCSNGCTFCQAHSIHGRKLRFRSLDGLRRPFEAMSKKNRKKLFFITSNILSYAPDGHKARLQSLRELGEMAAIYNLTDLHLGSFPSEVRPEYLDEQALSIFSKYCSNRNIVIGAQTGSERLLESLRRGHTVEDVKRAAVLARAHGFRPLIDIIFGLPGETLADRKETFMFIDWLLKHAGARIHLHYFLSLPGTALWGHEASNIDVASRNRIDRLLRYGRAYGDIWFQEKCSSKIFDWKDQKLISV